MNDKVVVTSPPDKFRDDMGKLETTLGNYEKMKRERIDDIVKTLSAPHLEPGEDNSIIPYFAEYNLECHKFGKRKFNNYYNIQHAIGVGQSIKEVGGDLSQILAGLMHDSIEDKINDFTNSSMYEKFRKVLNYPVYKKSLRRQKRYLLRQIQSNGQIYSALNPFLSNLDETPKMEHTERIKQSGSMEALNENIYNAFLSDFNAFLTKLTHHEEFKTFEPDFFANIYQVTRNMTRKIGMHPFKYIDSQIVPPRPLQEDDNLETILKTNFVKLKDVADYMGSPREYSQRDKKGEPLSIPFELYNIVKGIYLLHNTKQFLYLNKDHEELAKHDTKLKVEDAYHNLVNILISRSDQLMKKIDLVEETKQKADKKIREMKESGELDKVTPGGEINIAVKYFRILERNKQNLQDELSRRTQQYKDAVAEKMVLENTFQNLHDGKFIEGFNYPNLKREARKLYYPKK